MILRWLGRNPGWHYAGMIASGAKIDINHVFVHLDYLHALGLIEARKEPAPWPNQEKGAEPRSQYRLAGKSSEPSGGDEPGEPEAAPRANRLSLLGRHDEEPDGCPKCGAVAGACAAYPHCLGNPLWAIERGRRLLDLIDTGLTLQEAGQLLDRDLTRTEDLQ